VLVAASLTILARFGWLAWRRWREPMLYAAFHAFVPVGLAFLVSLKKSFFDRRYMIPASPYLYLLVAAAVWEIVLLRRSAAESRWKTSAGLAAAAAFCLLLVVSLYQYYFAARFAKEQWREAVAYIEASSSADGKDLVVVDPDYLDICYRYYQRRNLPIWQVTPEVQREAVNSDAMIRDHVNGYHKVWLVYSHNVNEYLLAKLKSLYAEKSARDFPLSNRIEVYEFQVSGAD